MYNYNTVDGKLARIEELKKYINLIGEVPGDHIGYLDAQGISKYLIDIKKDLEKQVAPEIAKRHNMKRYTYHYLAEDITILADGGAEANAEFMKLNNNKSSTGDVELIDNVTGEITILYKLDLGEPLEFLRRYYHE